MSVMVLVPVLVAGSDFSAVEMERTHCRREGRSSSTGEDQTVGSIEEELFEQGDRMRKSTTRGSGTTKTDGKKTSEKGGPNFSDGPEADLEFIYMRGSLISAPVYPNEI